MITDRDIDKLKTVFATKEDLISYATKEALAELSLEVGEMRDEMNERFNAMDEKFYSMDAKLDRFLGTIDDIRQEEAAGAVTLERHSRQIKALATHTNATLPD